MSFGPNLLSDVSTDWTLTGVTWGAGGELTFSAGGSASITYTELNGTNLLPEAIKIAVTAASYPSRYLVNIYIRLTINYIDGNTFDAILPITDIANGFEAILRPTISNYDIDVSSFTSLTYYIYSGAAIVLNTYTFQKSEGDALIEDTLYYGIKISTEEGIVITRSDDKMKAIWNANQFTMQAYDEATSTLVDKIYFDPVEGTYIFDGKLSADIIEAVTLLVTQSLYAERGYIADLTVDSLDTSQKLDRYLNEDTSDVNYIHIEGKDIDFITASTTGAASEQAETRKGQPLYWTDDTYTYLTIETTDYPAMQYVYTELTKLKQFFEYNGTNYIPKMVFGAGTGTGDNGKLFMYKDEGAFHIDYNSTIGEIWSIWIDDEGVHFDGTPEIIYETETVIKGMVQLWVQDDMPAAAKVNDVWVDTNDYTRYDKTALTGAATLAVSANELITASGTFTITLHEATSAGIVKMIANIGTGIITLAGTINGVSDMYLYPDESVSLITDGSGWRVM